MSYTLKYLQRFSWFRRINYKFGHYRATDIVKPVIKYLNKHDLILDVGSGGCNVCDILVKKGFNVVPIDVDNLSVVDGVKPVVYDGINMPFRDNQFDTSIIITVLHHTSNPEDVVLEAKRVSKNMVITEDVYDSKVGKYITFILDSLLNLEFIGHPHTNKTDEVWRIVFNRLGLKIKKVEISQSFLFFTHATYYLERID